MRCLIRQQGSTRLEWRREHGFEAGVRRRWLWVHFEHGGDGATFEPHIEKKSR